MGAAHNGTSRKNDECGKAEACQILKLKCTRPRHQPRGKGSKVRDQLIPPLSGSFVCCAAFYCTRYPLAHFSKAYASRSSGRQRTAAQSLLPFGRKRCDSGDQSRSHRCSAQKLPFSFFLSVTHKIHDSYKSLSAAAWQAADPLAAALFPSRNSQCANSVVCGSSRSKRPIRLIFRCSRSADRSRTCPPCVLSLLR